MLDAVQVRPVDVEEESFRVGLAGREVPVVVWRPVDRSTSPQPAILLGHGGSGHKRSERTLQLARWFVVHAGVTVVAIDGPYHGDRVAVRLTQQQVQARIAADGAAEVVEGMTGDWIAAIEAIKERGWADTTALGYLGLSMGTRYGLPLVAALGERCQAAVFGKFGLWQTSTPTPADRDMSDLIAQAARRVRTRVLFHMQWDDELFPRDGQLLLFEHLGSADKRLIAFPGRHFDRHRDAVQTWQEFLVHSLTRDDFEGRST